MFAFVPNSERYQPVGTKLEVPLSGDDASVLKFWVYALPKVMMLIDAAAVVVVPIAAAVSRKRKLPRQVDSSEVEFFAASSRSR